MRNSSDELRFATISTLSAMLRRRKVSAWELTRDALAALETDGRRYNAVAEITADIAEEQARQADVSLASGTPGPLCGIPYGIKDLLAARGSHTRWGAPPFRSQRLEFDAEVVRRLRTAGAVLVGKLAMIELAGAGFYANASASIDGPGLNPWNTGFWSGGSSSGSGAAVAAGLVPFAIGSETGGSIVIPSAFCGISGLRPSRGTVSRTGAMPIAWSMDKLGPMARSAHDCELVLVAMAGLDPRDAASYEAEYRPTRRSDFRIGVLPSKFDEFPQTGAVFSDALKVFADLGMQVQSIELPAYDYQWIYETVLAGETGASQAAFIRSGRLGELLDDVQQAGLREAYELSTIDYVKASEQRAAAKRDLRSLFKEVDLVVAPTVLGEATPIDAELTHIRPGLAGYHASLGAVAGLPGISIPMGFGPSGLPLGLSVVGDWNADSAVLRAARLFQTVTDWHTRRPQKTA